MPAFPFLAGGVPIVAEDGVGSIYEIRERNVRLDFSIDVVLDGRVRIDVVEAGFEVFPELGVVADDNARGFDQAGFDSIVEAEVADDPLKQGFFAATLACRGKGRGGKVEARQNAPCAVNAVEATDPFSCFFDVFLGNAL